jgi:hypothetical protein
MFWAKKLEIYVVIVKTSVKLPTSKLELEPGTGDYEQSYAELGIYKREQYLEMNSFEDESYTINKVKTIKTIRKDIFRFVRTTHHTHAQTSYLSPTELVEPPILLKAYKPSLGSRCSPSSSACSGCCVAHENHRPRLPAH